MVRCGCGRDSEGRASEQEAARQRAGAPDPLYVGT